MRWKWAWSEGKEEGMKLVYIPRQIDRFKGEDAMGDPAYQEAAGQDRIRVEAKKDAGFVRSEKEEKIPARGKIFTGSLKQAKIRTDWGGN